jgi:hypothetical protein
MPRQGLAGGSKPAGKKRADRRARVRFVPMQEIVCYYSIAGGEYARAHVYDLSPGGVCLLVRGRVEAGAVAAVELINGPHTFLCARTLQVLRVLRSIGTDSVIGGAFDRCLAYDDLLPFLL